MSDWVKCPVCDEDDMQKEDGYISCSNLNCGSNGGDNFYGRDKQPDPNVTVYQDSQYKYHREDGPAIERSCHIRQKVKHDNGLTIVGPSPLKEYWLHGERITTETDVWHDFIAYCNLSDADKIAIKLIS